MTATCGLLVHFVAIYIAWRDDRATSVMLALIVAFETAFR